MGVYMVCRDTGGDVTGHRVDKSLFSLSHNGKLAQVPYLGAGMPVRHGPSLRAGAAVQRGGAWDNLRRNRSRAVHPGRVMAPSMAARS